MSLSQKLSHPNKSVFVHCSCEDKSSAFSVYLKFKKKDNSLVHIVNFNGRIFHTKRRPSHSSNADKQIIAKPFSIPLPNCSLFILAQWP